MRVCVLDSNDDRIVSIYWSTSSLTVPEIGFPIKAAVGV